MKKRKPEVLPRHTDMDGLERVPIQPGLVFLAEGRGARIVTEKEYGGAEPAPVDPGALAEGEDPYAA